MISNLGSKEEFEAAGRAAFSIYGEVSSWWFSDLRSIWTAQQLHLHDCQASKRPSSSAYVPGTYAIWCAMSGLLSKEPANWFNCSWSVDRIFPAQRTSLRQVWRDPAPSGAEGHRLRRELSRNSVETVGRTNFRPAPWHTCARLGRIQAGKQDKNNQKHHFWKEDRFHTILDSSCFCLTYCLTLNNIVLEDVVWKSHDSGAMWDAPVTSPPAPSVEYAGK